METLASVSPRLEKLWRGPPIRKGCAQQDPCHPQSKMPIQETEHKSFFRTHRVLAFLPLLVMGAGVWYFIYGKAMRAPGETAVPRGSRIFGAAASPQAAASPKSPAVVSGEAGIRQPEAYDPKAGIDIQGSEEFKNQITHALKLIWMSDRDTFLFLKRNLYIIRNENKTGFYMDNGRPVAALSNDHAFRSLTWCAGIIAHQGWHAWYTLTRKKKSRITPPLPGDKDERVMDINPARFDYKGLDAIFYIEDKASAFQLDVLKKVGAPAAETRPVQRRAPRDFQYAHDGNYAINP